jgi:hypothetical protein
MGLAEGQDGLGELVVELVLVLSGVASHGDGVTPHVGLEGLGMFGGILGEGVLQAFGGRVKAGEEGGSNVGVQTGNQFIRDSEVEGGYTVFSLADEVLDGIGGRRR